MRLAKRSFSALLLSFALTLTMLVSGPVASASAATTPTITVTPAPREGGNVTIKGSGFSDSGTGIYVAIANDKIPEFYGHSNEFVGADGEEDFTQSRSTIWVYPSKMAAVGQSFAQGVAMGKDGSFEVKMFVPKYKEGVNYNVLTTKAHGQGKSDRSADTRTRINYQPAPKAEPTKEKPTAPETGTTPGTENGGDNGGTAGGEAGNDEGEGDQPGQADPQPAPGNENSKPGDASNPAKPAQPAEHVCPAKQDVRVDEPGLAETSFDWAINQLFAKYAKEKGYKMYVQGGYPAGNSVNLNRNLIPEVQGNNLSLTWEGGVQFKEGNQVRYEIKNPRLVIKDQTHADLYLTFAADGKSAQTVLFGTVTGPVYVDASGFIEALRLENGTVTMKPEAALQVPGISPDTELPKLSFRYDLYDRDGRYLKAGGKQPVEYYKEVWNLAKNCGQLPWMTHYAVRTPAAPKPVVDEVPPPKQISVEEENAKWNDGDIAAAPAGDLYWGIKASWRSYIGGGKLSEGVTLDRNGYTFHNGRIVEDKKDGSKVIQYQGRIHFEAYNKILYMTFSDPQVRIDKDGKAVLWFKQWFYNGEGQPETEGTYFPAVTITKPLGERGEDLAVDNSASYLTSQMRDIFIFAYRTGLRMANVSFAVKAPVAETVKTPEKTVEAPKVPVVKTPEAPKVPAPTKPVAPAGPQPTKPADPQPVAPANPKPVKPAPVAPETKKVTKRVCAPSSTQFDLKGGNLNWGLRASFRKYLTGLAKGKWELADGATYNGKDFVFPTTGGTYNVEKHAGQITYRGSVHFTGHGGILDVRLANPTLRFKGTDAMLSAEVASNSLEGKNTNYGRVDLAAVKLAKPENGKNGLTLTGATVTLTEDGAKAFAGFYQTGEGLDPLTATTQAAPKQVCHDVVVEEPQQPGTPEAPAVPKPGTTEGTVEGTQPGTEPGVQPGAGTGDDLDFDVPPAPTKPKVPQQPNVPAQPNVPGLPNVPGVLPGSPAAPSAGNGNLSDQLVKAPEKAAEKKVCQADPNQYRITSGSLNWGVRQSFTTYIRGLAKGGWDLGGGATWTGSAFNFPVASGIYNSQTGKGQIRYSGTVHFNGHGGILNLKIANPTLVINGRSGQLYATVFSNDMQGKGTDYGRVLLANVSLSSVNAKGGKLNLSSASVNLTAEGAKAFAGFYQPGEKLDNLSGNATLAAGSICDKDGNLKEYTAGGQVVTSNGGGAQDGLAKTGPDGGLLGSSMLLGLAGLMLAAVSRKRRTC
ncbi:hypothetical protein BSR28_04710 [Boudabousia liubingyangii]|uniref:HtaA domain-containing protein n=1 Tax=Boudabousia liubingyangii TaxID=1921764 RepID=UPI00093A10BB|nr:HtaA domain-containing protein [Boudabousia liubingyangii]OKL46752.1 hypothetical protein BSR28_04710 [Boudabousia liubingyangii]